MADWLRSRKPEPPAGIRPWLSVDGEEPTTLDALIAGGLAEFARARSVLGPDRESALHLLAADALVTYACEAALETPDPAAALTRVLGEVVAPVP